jgi:polysaccharide biosynthesis transport protein
VLMSGIVMTRELMNGPAAGARGAPLRRARRRQNDAGAAAESDTVPGDEQPAPADRGGRAGERQPADTAGALAARLRSIVQRESAHKAAPQREPAQDETHPDDTPLVGVPVSAIEEFARNLQAAGVDGSQIAFFAVAPQLDTGWPAVRFARALAGDARVVLVALGASDAAIREISSDPGAPGVAELTAGAASFGDIITRDTASSLNLIAAGRGARRGALLAAPDIVRNFAALAQAYPHVVIDAGALGGRDAHDGSQQELEEIAGIATHAMLLVETLAGAATAQARDSLLDAGFDNVTIVIAGRDRKIIPPVPAAAA